MKLIPASSTGTERSAEITLALVVTFALVLLIVPLPPMVLDLFLAMSIGLSLMVLLTALQTRSPLDFSTFPSVLLLLTLFRLALNVSSTRLILSDGDAGRVIQAFGEFVIGGNYAVGLVIFLILVGINFIVITKGAGRVAEVAARFTLDAMPGKQMAIDADLNAGLIDEGEARTRREDISRQADFYGAMDGSSKFVKGDAIAALLITGINIVGGIFIGVVQRGLSFGQAATDYTILTVGDGIVSQIPALIVSTAAGLMVTHVAGGSRMGPALARQLGAHPRVIWIVAGVLATFAVIPGLPAMPFLLLAGGAVLLARGAQAGERARSELVHAAETARDEELPPDGSMQELLHVDPVELDAGYALIPLVDEAQGGELLQRISLLRRQAAQELGLMIPPVRIRDDVRLPANEYVIRLRGIEIARAEVMPRLLLALDMEGASVPIEGIETVDPSFGMPARWIEPEHRVDAEAAGYVVVEPTTVVATHLMEMLQNHAADLLGRQEVREMVDALQKTHPALVEDVVPAKVPLGVLHRVLQRLLRERMPIRDLVTVLEALGDGAEQTKDPEALTEQVRRALSNVIARRYMDENGAIRALTMGPRVEAALIGFFNPRASRDGVMTDPESISAPLRALGELARTHTCEGRPLPLITPPGLRVGIRKLVEPVLPDLPVVSLAELPPHVKLESVATWEVAAADRLTTTA